jgi:hypothetical protein
VTDEIHHAAGKIAARTSSPAFRHSHLPEALINVLQIPILRLVRFRHTVSDQANRHFVLINSFVASGSPAEFRH